MLGSTFFVETLLAEEFWFWYLLNNGGGNNYQQVLIRSVEYTLASMFVILLIYFFYYKVRGSTFFFRYSSGKMLLGLNGYDFILFVITAWLIYELNKIVGVKSNVTIYFMLYFSSAVIGVVLMALFGLIWNIFGDGKQYELDTSQGIVVRKDIYLP